jgi:hypothetical protein
MEMKSRKAFFVIILLWVLIRLLSPDWLDESLMGKMDYLVLILVVTNYLVSFFKWKSFSIIGHYVIPLLGIMMMMFVYESNEHGRGINFRIGYFSDRFLGINVYSYFSESFFTYFFGLITILIFVLELVFIFRKGIRDNDGNVAQKRTALEN